MNEEISRTRMNIYQLAGLDELERGFTRQVECTFKENEYHVVLRYERLKFEEHSLESEHGALDNLISTLQTRGYTQLRSQLIFRGEVYLGSQETWVSYPDKGVPGGKPLGVMERVWLWLMRGKNPRPHDDPLRHC